MADQLEDLRARLTKAIRLQATRPVCQCGHIDSLHSALTNRDVCAARGCQCEWYVEREASDA